jgi:hypothetical protein
MPAIITKEFSSRSLGDFINTVKDDKKLFIGLGKRSTTWTSGPDQIQNTPEEKTAFWDELLGVKKIAIKDIIPMIPEIKWQSGLSYVVFDETKEQAFDDAFYVVTPKYEVFTCTSKPNSGEQTDIAFTTDDTVSSTTTDLSQFPVGSTITISGSTSNDGTYTVETSAATTLTTVEKTITTEAAGDTVTINGLSTDQPILADAVSGTFTGTDDYVWQYQYVTNRYEYQQTPTGWMSINYGDSIDTSDLDRNDDAFILLGSRYLLVRVEIKDPDTSGEFTAGSFRQIGLISHPRLSADDSLVINTYEPVANLKSYSGYLIYLENREPEDVISGQNTDLKIILRF